jgi:hypothetical protein
MLVIVDLTANEGAFPVQVLKEVDEALRAAGFKIEVHSVIRPGKEFSATYEGPDTDRSHVEDILRPIAERNKIDFSVEVEESVSFP